MARRPKGYLKLLTQIERLPKAVKEETRRGLQGAAQDISGLAERLAPMGDKRWGGHTPGALKKSIGWRFGDTKRVKYAFSTGSKLDHALSVVIFAGNAEVRYAHIVEFGADPHPAGGQFAGAMHPGAPAQPYFFPAVRAKKKSAKARVARAARKGIKRAIT